MEKSTLFANEISRETHMEDMLAFYANDMPTKHGNSEDPNVFGTLIDSAIDRAGLKKKAVAKEAEIHPTSLSRIIAGERAKRETAITLIRAINRLAGRNVIDEVFALQKLGYFIEGSRPQKPQSVAEFVERLSDMGFEIHLSTNDLEGLGPDDLQDTIDEIEARIMVKARRRSLI